MTETFSLELFYFDAGGGHRSAAEALQEVLAQDYPAWRVTPIHLQDLLQDIDPFPKARKNLRSEDVYNKYLKSGRTYGSRAMLRGLQYGIALMAPLIEKELRGHWRRSRPDLVVSLIPNFNGPLYRALRAVHADAPYVTIMTDFADCPPHFWQEKQDQYLVCGTEKAMQQAETLGYRREVNLFRVSGMILKPKFYRPRAPENAAAKASLGLDPHAPTALVGFGGYPASKQVAQVLDSLDSVAAPLQAIVICGNNEELRESLRGRERCRALPHTRHLPPGHDMPALMDIADIAIGKPGPAIISESVQRGCPVLVERSARTMLQERYNADWVREMRVGAVVKSFEQAGPVIAQALQSGLLDEWRRNCARIGNRAVYEVPLILEQILRERAGRSAGRRIVAFPESRAAG